MTDASADESLPYPHIILPPGFDRDAERTAVMYGILEGVKVRTAPTSEFDVTFITTAKLADEIDGAQGLGIQWFAKPAMIVVSNISTWIVDLAVRWAYGQDYFTHLVGGPIVGEKTSAATLVFPGGLSQAAQEDAFEREYIEGGVAVLNDGSRRPAYFVTPNRLRQDIEVDALYGRPLFVEPGLIAVSDVRIELCENAVLALGSQGFFDHLKRDSAH